MLCKTKTAENLSDKIKMKTYLYHTTSAKEAIHKDHKILYIHRNVLSYLYSVSTNMIFFSPPVKIQFQKLI